MLNTGGVTKVMWYSSIIPRLKRLFRNKDNAKLMQWHKEEFKKDSMLRHPADGSQWRKIDRTYPEFDLDTRNIRFGVRITRVSDPRGGGGEYGR